MVQNSLPPVKLTLSKGIHGRPQTNYDGVSGVSNPENPGYCTHSSILFPTWHRPYLALLEQRINAHAVAIANQYPSSTRSTYVAAARNLRLPYFDWAKNPSSQGVYPSAFSSQTATIITPTGTKTIPNPLFSYNFHPNPGNLFYQPFTYWNTTLRWPTSDSDPNAQSRNQLTASNLASWQPSLRDRLYTVLTNYANYNQFSNSAWITNSNTQDSIESIHDVVHGAVGGSNYGHMSIIDVSAFDPIFWMHHAMVDRAFALWQVAHPNSWVQNKAEVVGTYFYSSGYVSKPATPLKPFKSSSSGAFWTSDSVRDWTKFGYTYPELPNGMSTSASSVRTAINNLYGSTTSSARIKRSAVGSAINKLRSRIPGAMPGYTFAGTAESDRDYMANIRAQKNALGQSYFIYFFLGDYSTSNPDNWALEDSFVGANPVLASLKTEEELEKEKPLIIGGSVPLNTKLQEKMEAGELKSLDEKTVTDYLTKNLQWEVQAANGTVLDKDNVPNLLVSVASAEVVPASSSDEFPKRQGNAKIHPEVTQDKAAGLCEPQVKLYSGATS